MTVNFSPGTLVTDFNVGDLVWSLVPPTNKNDPTFPCTDWVVTGIKGERTYEIVSATNGNKVVRNGSFLRSVSFSPPPIAEANNLLLPENHHTKNVLIVTITFHNVINPPTKLLKVKLYKIKRITL